MKFTAVLACLAAVAPALAANITVVVGASESGAAGLVFRPQVITAAVGDLVNFEFRGGNHTVTQSSFANPCTQQFNTVTQQNGFTSPFMPYDANSGVVGVYTLEITQVASPVWFFCARAPHCKGGMYGAINPPTTGERTFEAFAASVPNADEPGFGVTAPFTPPSASGTTGTGASQTNTGASQETSTPNSASTLSARSSIAVALVGLVASLVL